MKYIKILIVLLIAGVIINVVAYFTDISFSIKLAIFVTIFHVVANVSHEIILKIFHK